MAETKLKNQAFENVNLGAWTSFTPSWTNLTVGNATNAGAYCQIGKTVHFRVNLLIGTTTSVGTNVQLTFPVSSVVTGTDVIATVMIIDAGTASYSGILRADKYVLYDNGTRLDLITATAPMTWTTGDTLAIAGTYEAA